VRAIKVSPSSSASSTASCSSSSSSKHSPGSTHTAHSDTDSERHCDDDSQLPLDFKVSPLRSSFVDLPGASSKLSPGAFAPPSMLSAALPHLYSSPWTTALNPLLQQQLMQAASLSGLYPFGLLHPTVSLGGISGLSSAFAGNNLLTSAPSATSSPVKQAPNVVVSSSDVAQRVKAEPLDEVVKSSSTKAECESASSSPPPANYVINPATGNKVRRNYKNTTKERRSEANARERTRVHTIGASFDQLRHLMPSLSADQKLSKLSILRISCKYILLLGAMTGKDYSEEQRGYSVAECIDMLNDTILAESKAKRQTSDR
jgi:hypothetical protein